MPANPSNSVALHVEEYASKGVLKKLRHQLTPNGEKFEFQWLSLLKPMVLEVDQETATLRLAHFLTSPPATVVSYVEKFLEDLSPGGAAPGHKKIDPSIAEVRLRHAEDGDAHLELQLNAPEAEYGTKRIFNLGSELYHLLQTVDAQYMYDTFGGSTE